MNGVGGAAGLSSPAGGTLFNPYLAAAAAAAAARAGNPGATVGGAPNPTAATGPHSPHASAALAAMAAAAAASPSASAAAAAAAAAAATTTMKDSRWLTLEVCRQYQRKMCSRDENECKFAHPPPHVDVQNGRVICCYDSIKVRSCTYSFHFTVLSVDSNAFSNLLAILPNLYTKIDNTGYFYF